MNILKNNVALITGATSGIGLELAKIHAQRGGDLILVSRDESTLQERKSQLLSAYDIGIEVYAQDLSQESAAKTVHEKIVNDGHEISTLINNAGFGDVTAFADQDTEKIRAMIGLNVTAVVELTRLILPGMLARGEGKVLNTSSTASLMPGPMQAVYFATKAFVTSWSNALSSELDNKNITVTALLPGATSTGFGRASGMDKTSLFDKTASAEVVARAGYEGMLDGKLNVIAGVTLSQKVLFALMPLLPKNMLMSAVRKMQTPKKQ